MKSWLILLLLMLLVVSKYPTQVKAEASELDQMSQINFIPDKLLNPDGSDYEKPEDIADYVGLYVAEAPIDEMDITFKVLVNIREDGLFNLAYYFTDLDPYNGVRYYVNEANEIQEIAGTYFELMLFTGLVFEGEAGLEAALIGEKIAPVVLLNQQGQAEELYAYQSMTRGFEEEYSAESIEPTSSLTIRDGRISLAGNDLLGFKTEKALNLTLTLVEDDESQFLVQETVYEILQYNFDSYVTSEGDFIKDYPTANDFVQKVLASYMHINRVIPHHIQIELLDPQNLLTGGKLEAASVKYAMLVNQEILYAYDGTDLYRSRDFEVEGRVYSSNNWNRVRR